MALSFPFHNYWYFEAVFEGGAQQFEFMLDKLAQKHVQPLSSNRSLHTSYIEIKYVWRPTQVDEG